MIGPIIIICCFVFGGVSLLIRSNSVQRILAYALLFSAISAYFFRDVLAPGDSVAYKGFYVQLNSLADILNIYHGDLFFSFVQYIGRSLGLSFAEFSHAFFSLLLIISFFSLVRIYSLRNVVIPFVAFLTLESYIFLFSNGMRQGLAAALWVLSISFLLERRLIPFFLLAALACLSHSSIALIYISFAVVWALSYFRSVNSLRFAYIPLLLIVLYFFSRWMALTFAPGAFEHYSTREYDITTAIYRILFLILVLFLGAVNIGMYREDYKNKVVILWLISVVGCAIGLNSAPIVFSRLIYYGNFFLPVYYFVFLNGTGCITRRSMKFLIWGISVAYGIAIFSYPSVSKVLYGAASSWK